MIEVQYNFFCDLDRRCLAEGLDDGRCTAVVELKRQTIDAPWNRANPVVAEVLAGKTTFVAIYDSFSREFRGFRRFGPISHDPVWNERLDNLARIVPNVRHFRRRSRLATDNPLNMTIYGAMAGFAVGVFMSVSDAGGSEPGAAAANLLSATQLALAGGMASAGFVLGTLAMLRYRTRDYHQIHAREAAGYMDLNYGFFRRGDWQAWATCLRGATAGGNAPPTRPD